MNAGKSTSLQQVAYNYEERGQSVNLFTAAIDDLFGEGKIVSRRCQRSTKFRHSITVFSGQVFPFKLCRRLIELGKHMWCPTRAMHGSVAQIARDSLRDSKVLVGFHEQTHTPDLPHDELALL